MAYRSDADRKKISEGMKQKWIVRKNKPVSWSDGEKRPDYQEPEYNRYLRMVSTERMDGELKVLREENRKLKKQLPNGFQFGLTFSNDNEIIVEKEDSIEIRVNIAAA